MKAKLLSGTYSRQAKTTWTGYHKAYTKQAPAALSSSYSLEQVLDIFEKITKPKYMVGLNTNQFHVTKAIRREKKIAGI